MNKPFAITLWSFAVLFASSAIAGSDSDPGSEEPESRAGITPDLREDETKLKLQKGDLVIVPIPISNPTLDAGLVVGGAYFYPQTDAEKNVQPASVTAVVGMYTSNNSFAYGIAQQNYWQEDKWRFGGVFGHAELDLRLRAPTASGDSETVNWLIDGNFVQAQFSGNFAGKWYAGLTTRFIDVTQSIGSDVSPETIDTGPETRSVGLGVNLEYDRRDMPLNTYDGNIFQIKSLFNDESFGSDTTYQSYELSYRSYHETKLPLVLAWEIKGCQRGGAAPLWDLCGIDLRGFSATDYLGKRAVSAQFEARWRVSKKWGLVGFAGGGYIAGTYSEVGERDIIPSYGVGLRFMVLQAKRINLRLDFARSTDSDAIHLSVGEAF